MEREREKVEVILSRYTGLSHGAIFPTSFGRNRMEVVVTNTNASILVPFNDIGTGLSEQAVPMSVKFNAIAGTIQSRGLITIRPIRRNWSDERLMVSMSKDGMAIIEDMEVELDGCIVTSAGTVKAVTHAFDLSRNILDNFNDEGGQ